MFSSDKHSSLYVRRVGDDGKKNVFRRRRQSQLYFDTLKIKPQLDISEIRRRAHEAKINIRYFPDGAVSSS